MSKVFVDLHVIQSVPPNCLNRDDTGSPKTAIYGGVRRARVSSQAWKRAMRLMFAEYFDESALSSRTKYVFGLVADEILKASPNYTNEQAMEKAIKALDSVKLKPGKKGENKVDALFFMSRQQAKNVAALALEAIDAKDIKKALQEGNSVDLALFGRMVAADPELNCDASSQVAHAISTHRVENEYDYFTAVDDLAREIQDHAGAGMIGTVEYNSATLYRYATVAVHDLYGQLAENDEALEKALQEFTRAFVCSMPTGKQNTFAAHTMPEAVLAVIRTDRPLNLADAFESAVRPKEGEGYAPASARALVNRAQEVYDDFCAAPSKSYVVGKLLEGLESERLNFDDLLIRLSKDARNAL
ncbi:MAG: type I-E CRISPR-associated protein Cas7/Cse4/CasC [Oscillospiraceae bacterium]|nr:type I-E CRISPR-associated protein Cas7/Cse4/CasC [Oscillospiraceae bacterium]